MQRLARFKRLRWLLVGFAHLLTVLVAYQCPYRFLLAIGRLSDQPFVEGFLERSEEGDFSTRWTQSRSTVVLDGVEWGREAELTLRLSPGERPPLAPAPEVTVLANGVEVGRVEAKEGFRNYTLNLPREIFGPGGSLRLDLVVPPFRRLGREVGVLLEKVKLQSDPRTRALPPVPTTLFWTLAGLLWLALLTRTPIGSRPLPLALLLLGGLSALAGAIALARPWAALAAEDSCLALALAYGVAWQLERWRNAHEGKGTFEFLSTLGIEDRRRRRCLEAVLIAFLAVQFSLTVLRPLMTAGPKDFRIYYGAGTLWLEGGDYYDIAAFRSRFGPDVPKGTGFAFTNPPSSAAFYAAFAWLPLVKATAWWRILNIVLLIAAFVLLCSSWTRPDEAAPSPVWLALAFAYSEPLRVTLRMGQVGIVVLFLLSLSSWAYGRRRRTLAGASLALAALLKILPGFPAVYFLVRRDLRAASAAVLTGGAVLVTLLALRGAEPFVIFSRRVLPALEAPAAYFGNQSIQGFLSRAVGGEFAPQARFNFSFDPPGPEGRNLLLAQYATAAFFVGLTALFLSRANPKDHLVGALELATMVPLMLLVAPLVWEFYLVWLLVSYAAFAAILSARPLRRTTHLVTLSVVAASWLLAEFDTTDVYRQPGFPVALMSLGLYSILLVYLGSLYLLRAVRNGDRMS